MKKSISFSKNIFCSCPNGFIAASGLVLVFILLRGTVFGAQSISSAPEVVKKEIGSEQPKQGIAIKNFIMTGGDNKYQLLKTSLRELIALGLLNNENVKYWPHEELRNADRAKASAEQIQKREDDIFDDALLDKLHINLIVSGSYFESSGKIYITANLEGRSINKERKTFLLKPAAANAITEAVGQFMPDLIEEINRIAGKYTPVFAVLCFKDISGEKLESNKWRERDMAVALFGKLKEKKEIKLVPFDETMASCQDAGYKVPATTDAIIKGSLFIEKDQITITPELEIGNTGPAIRLGSQMSEVSNYYIMSGNLVKEIRGVIDAIVDKDGRLNIAPLVYPGQTAEQFLEKGKAFLAQGNLSVAAIMLNKALEMNPDSGEAHYNLGAVRYLQGNYNPGMEEFEKTLDLIKKKKEGKAPVDSCFQASVYQGEGRIYLAQHKYDTAITALSEASDLCPDLDEIYYSLGEAYFASGNPTKAVQQFNKVLDKDPTNKQTLMMLGRIYYAQKSFQKSINAYKRVLKIAPKDAEVLSELSEIYNERGLKLIEEHRFTESLANYEEALNLGCSSQDIYFYKGYILAKLNRNSEAEDAYTQSIKIRPQSEAYNNRGLIYEKQGKPDKALEDYSKAIELDPKYANAYNSRGVYYHNRNKPDKALEDYNKSIELDPNYAEAYNNRGLVYEKQGKPDKALEDYNKAVELDPNYANAYNSRGVYYYNRDKPDKALEDYNKAIELDPSYTEAYNNRGLVYEKQGKPDKALEDYNKSIELDPNYANAYNNRGIYYYNRDKLDKAFEDYNKAIELDPKYAFAYNNRGACYYKQEKLEKAFEDFNRALELDPKYALAYLNRGVVREKLKKLDQALEDYDKVVELDPKYADAYNKRGAVNEKLNKHDKAIEDYNKAVEINPGFVDAYINRGFLYGKLKGFEKASEDYSKAVELKTSAPGVYLNLSEALIISESYKKALDNTSRSFPLMVELKDKTINLYLKCITEKLLGMDTSGTESALNQLLKQKIDFSWSFEEIETWAANENLPDLTKNYIKEKTELLKKFKQ